MRVLDAALRGVAWRPGTQYEVDHLTTALGLVEADLGIAVMPRSALVAFTPSGLAVRELVDPRVTRSLGFFRRRAAKPTPIARELLTVSRRFAASLRKRDQPL